MAGHHSDHRFVGLVTFIRISIVAKMVRLIFVRHGETEGNKQLFFQFPHTTLTENGKGQAKLVAQRILADFMPSLIFSSPFSRARETAFCIGQALNLNITFNDLLQERNFGFLQGKFYKYLGENAINIFSPTQNIDGGEKFLDFQVRCEATVEFIKDAVKNHNSKGDIVFVSHGLTLGEIMRKLSKFSPSTSLSEPLHFINTSVTVVNAEYESITDSFSCTFTNTFNCAKHLKQQSDIVEPKVHL